MHKFYKSSLVLLASIVCISVHCSSAGKEREWKKKSEATALSAEREQEATAESSEAAAEKRILKGVVQVFASGWADRCKIGLFNSVISSFENQINLKKEWSLFDSTHIFHHRGRKAMAGICRDIPPINENSSLQDISTAYIYIVTARRGIAGPARGIFDPEYDDNDHETVLAEVSPLAKVLCTKGREEAFKGYNKEREKLNWLVGFFTDAEATSYEADKKYAFIAAMIKKHNITLSAPYSNSDFA